MRILLNCRSWLPGNGALLLVAILAGCGGGSDNDSASRTKLEGTAAVGAAIVSGTVTAKCQNGLTFSSPVTTDSEGRWTGFVDNGALPCALQVAWGSPQQTLHSYAAQGGVVNITPLTDLALALETGETPEDWFDNYSGATLDISGAGDELADKLALNGFSVPAGDMFTSPFVADHTGWDALLDQLANAISADSGIADYAALVDLVRGGSLDSLPAAPETFSISGTVTGATGAVSWQTWTGSGVLHYSGQSGSGAVTFTNPSGLIDGSVYQIVISASPAGQECVITNNSGSIVDSDVSNVAITCTTVVAPQTYSISGTISGATGNVVWETRVGGSIHHDGGNGNGAVTFTQTGGVASGSQYEVSVNTAPAGQTCSVTNGSGTLTANVSNISITCTTIAGPQNYSISGTVSGATGNVVWETRVGGSFHHDGGNGNGAVTFTQSGGVASGSQYQVLVNTAPAGQTCSVTNGSGTLTANVSNVAISCTTSSTPGDARLYDFSSLSLQPTVPSGMVPSAPTQSAINPGSQLASLFSQLGAAEKARIFAPVPANITTTIGNNVNHTYYRATQMTPDYSWVRVLDFGFGADGIPNTADDNLVAYSIYPRGMYGVQYSFVHPGHDNTWFTEDDVPGDHTSGNAIYFGSTSLLEFGGASEGAVLILSCLDVGDDGELFTADDKPSCSLGYQVAVLDGAGHRGQVVTYNQAGSDGLWFTADDRVKTYTLVNYNAQGVNLGSVTYNAAGTDGQWFTADDVVQLHTLTLLDEGFKPTYMATYNNRGTDNTWFTADDVVSAWTYYGYDAEGNNILVANHTNKRSDGLWFTADDTATALVSLKNEDGKELIAFTITGNGAMGADGRWLSGDESLYGYTYNDFDDNGYQTHRADISSTGADGKWFTADDLPGQYNYWMREYNSEGRITRQVNFDASRAPAAQAFSTSHISQYVVYNADFSISVNLSASNFGADGLPFTADDTAPWPYQVPVSNGFDLFNQPGPDALWFTADDISSGYVRREYAGKRKVLEETFDAAGVKQSYGEAVAIEAGKYRWNLYNRNANGDYELGSYSIIVEDENGYPLYESFYALSDGNWAITYVTYNERDENGNIIRQGWGYTPGSDGIWATPDDFATFGVSTFAPGNLLATSATERIGADNIWGTSDDSSQLSHIYIMANPADVLVQNTGLVPSACDDSVQTTGQIGVLVRDQNGDPLPGVVVQLNSDGATTVTDASGVASFSSISGPHDVHLFKDGYSWESFYCVAPGFDVVVKGKLNSLTEAPVTSMVSFTISGGEQVMMRLLDENGRSMETKYHSTASGGSYGSNYGDLHFNLPSGSEVSGELWVFKVDNYGKLLDAVSLGSQTFTTGNVERVVVSPVFSTVQPASIPVASQGVVTGPSGKSASLVVELGGLLPLQFFYESALGYRYLAVVPDVPLPLLAQPTAVSVTSYNWSAWYPGEYPQIGDGEFVGSIQTGFLYPPLVSTQDGSGTNPTIQWKAARELKPGFATVNSIELLDSTPAGWVSQWTIHTPAGQQSVVLPTPPAAINDPVLPEANYRLRLSVRAVLDKVYHDVVADDDLHDLDKTLATEVVKAGSEFGADDIRLLR